MKPFRIAALFVALTLLSSMSIATNSASAERRAETMNLKVVGVAAASGGTCTEGVPITTDTVCRGWYVLLFKEEVPRNVRHAQWGLQLGMDAGLVHPDGTDEPLFAIDGVTFDIDYTFDSKHLTFASVQAAVPMSDGTTRTVDLRWDGTSAPLQVAGNNGPFNTARDILPNYSDRCLTFNHHAHQTYRGPVPLTGTIDGTDVETIPYWGAADPFIGRGEFTSVFVRHGGQGC